MSLHDLVTTSHVPLHIPSEISKLCLSIAIVFFFNTFVELDRERDLCLKKSNTLHL